MKWIKSKIRSDKGFTLVEIIVVLVVLAILAAFTIPTMLGFVADAKAKAYIAEAREVYVAAQAVASEMVGSGRTDLDTPSSNPYDALNSYWVSNPAYTQPGGANYNPASEKMKNYLSNDLKFTTFDYRGNYATGDSYWYVIMGGTTGHVDEEKGKVLEIYYVKNGYVVWFKEGSATVKKLEPSTSRPNVPWNH